MWKYCLIVSALAATALSAFAEFSISPSNQVAYYHYPAPPKSQQFLSPVRQHSQTHQYQQQVQQQQVQQQQVQQQQVQQQLVQQPQQHQPQQHQSQQHQPQQHQLQQHPQQQQPQQQQYYQHQQQQQQQRYQQQKSQQQQRYLPPGAGKTQYPGSSNNYYRSSAVAKQFNSPALDNAAFNAALTNQGYTLRSNVPAAANTPSATLTATRPQSPAPQLASFAGNSASPSNSLNIKLPLPFNITPLNIAPLPLQAGTPYSALPRGVTSYGTTYPQRRR